VPPAVSSAGAPPPVGPYSQAVRSGQWLFVSGQIPLDASGALVPGDTAAQTRQALLNLGEILGAAGGSYANVVRTTVFLTDLNDIAAVNEVYAAFFAPPYPARSTVQAARLPRDARVEIDAIAAV
jgi:2-iminobutanoate/2-iminopropanoate deaminase